MATTQYIGARYVPLFAEPIEWDKTKQYEPLTIVTHNGNSYTSRQFVPTGVEITNETFWALTGNFNAQVEQYRKEVKAYDGRITTAQTTADNAKSLAETNEMDIAANDAELAGTADSGLKTMIVEETARAGAAETALGTRIDTADTNIAQIRADLTTETNARVTSDNALDARLDVLEEQKYMVVIGDSFSSSSQSGGTLWYEYVAKHYGLTPYTNASDGMGFVVGGNNNFSSQVDKAIAELDASKVSRVFVLGGLNDTRDSNYNSSTFGNAVGLLLDKIQNAFTNAIIEVYGPESFPNVLENNESASAFMCWQCMIRGIEYHDLSFAFQPYNNFFGGKTGSNEHPSAIGEKIIATHVIAHGNTSTAYFVSNEMFATAQKTAVLDENNVELKNVSIMSQGLIRSGNVVKFFMELDLTNIPTSTGTIKIRTPFRFSDYMHGMVGMPAGATTMCDVYISKVLEQNNAIASGWTDTSQHSIDFAINNGHPVTTGNGTARIVATFMTR